LSPEKHYSTADPCPNPAPEAAGKRALQEQVTDCSLVSLTKRTEIAVGPSAPTHKLMPWKKKKRVVN